MTREAMVALVEAGNTIGMEIEAREGYSGRGMYGRETCAVVVESTGSLIAIAVQAGLSWAFDHKEDGNDTIVEMLTDLRIDSMGKGIVAY